VEAPQDRHVQVGPFNTRYWAEGDHGSTVLLLHGVGAYMERWLPSFATLATQHRVYAMDMLGHGRTEKPSSATYSWEAGAQFVKSFMSAVKIETASLVGHSMGGAIALNMALKFPAMVAKLVLACSAGLGRETPLAFRLLTVPMLGEMLTRPSRKGSAQMLKSLVQDQTVLTDELFELQYEMVAQPGAQQAFLKCVRWGFNPFGPYEHYYSPILGGLASINHPTLIVWGREDPYFPVAQAQVAAKGLPNARLHIFDHCGHLPMLEKTQQFNALLLDFLAN
jgi:4,5:9,10-diseco-3-hydroxy-5,9,17-trioxoandrosta-1(10),2-diene-4-oate hydrolase